MDNKKIGKLIADLRKKKGLTQQELGDKVGVGFRSVSKWERGITLPDITIINEVSKILGISSDELLSGHISKEHQDNNKKKMSPKIKITLSIVVTLTIILALFLSYYNNKTYTYKTDSSSNEYYVEGKVIFEKRNIMIVINKLEFKNKELNHLKIKNYEYQIIANNEFIFGYGHSPDLKMEFKENTIENFLNEFRVNYNGEIISTRKEILNNKFVIEMEFITEDNKVINKEIELKLTTIKNNK